MVKGLVNCTFLLSPLRLLAFCKKAEKTSRCPREKAGDIFSASASPRNKSHQKVTQKETKICSYPTSRASHNTKQCYLAAHYLVMLPLPFLQTGTHRCPSPEWICGGAENELTALWPRVLISPLWELDVGLTVREYLWGRAIPSSSLCWWCCALWCQGISITPISQETEIQF